MEVERMAHPSWTDLHSYSKLVRKTKNQSIRGGVCKKFTSKVLPKYHLAVCQIEKNMATILNSVFCFLTNPEGFSAANRTINSNNWGKTLSCFKNFFKLFEISAKCRSLKMVAQSFAEARAVTRRSGALFAFIRHPIDRFLSGYVHLCRRYV
ncbi:unnamed protein product [Nippostrongylus brasiliensis]|uniref:Carbohydrate sulfotransferase n=1 Tax=Nippostrongylus brasiliensis TaxID=27835 RepID=A0A0N4XQR9_NIPBR|nr:unnamed protein product [Nippostrongylus brasiliensis]